MILGVSPPGTSPWLVPESFHFSLPSSIPAFQGTIAQISPGLEFIVFSLAWIALAFRVVESGIVIRNNPSATCSVEQANSTSQKSISIGP
jgi:hypothetical protein